MNLQMAVTFGKFFHTRLHHYHTNLALQPQFEVCVLTITYEHTREGLECYKHAVLMNSCILHLPIYPLHVTIHPLAMKSVLEVRAESDNKVKS